MSNFWSKLGRSLDGEPQEQPMNELDKTLYTIAAKEVAQKQFDPALFAKTFSEADGDEKKAVALYIRHRVVELRREFQQAAEKEALRIRQRAAWEMADRERILSGHMAVCPKCGFAGPGFVPFVIIEKEDRKCPQCRHEFTWSYVPSDKVHYLTETEAHELKKSAVKQSRQVDTSTGNTKLSYGFYYILGAIITVYILYMILVLK